MNTLHYIFDPLCGWCYGAAPLIDAAATLPDLQVMLHGGGMLAGPNRREITPQWRDYVMPHDHRIASLSGQEFGQAYFDGLLRDIGAPLDSAPPITAILVAGALDGRGLEMAHRVQRAHYVEGRRISEPAVLVDIAGEMGLDVAAFETAYASLAGDATTRHIEASRELLGRVGGQGFPTVVLERADGALVRIELGTWFGRAGEFAAALGQETTAAISPSTPQCGPDGCAIV